MTNWTDPQVYVQPDPNCTCAKLPTYQRVKHPLYREGWGNAAKLIKLSIDDLAVRDELHSLRGFKEGVESMAPRLHEEIAYQKQNAERCARRCEEYEEMLRYVKLKLSEPHVLLWSIPILNEIDAALEKPLA